MVAHLRAALVRAVLVQQGADVLDARGVGAGVCRVGSVVSQGAPRQCVDPGVELCRRAGGQLDLGHDYAFICGVLRQVRQDAGCDAGGG